MPIFVNISKLKEHAMIFLSLYSCSLEKTFFSVFKIASNFPIQIFTIEKEKVDDFMEVLF